MESIIRLEKLTKKFNDDVVLYNISKEFEKGKIHGIVGNNGSGKTVLMKCICGFLKPSSGKVLINNKQVGKEIDFPDDIGLIIETPGFLPNLSGFKNLNMLASLKKKIGNGEIIKALEMVGLDPYSRKPIGKYSLGMRQRLGIAQAIMENPSILILDEPFNGLDKYGLLEMRKLIKELKNDGKTILLASHNQADIDELCDTVYEIDAGNLIKIRD